MTAWRGLYSFFLVTLVALPLLAPFGELTNPAAWSFSADDFDRIERLGANTLGLTTATAALSAPLGASLAVLLFRTSFFGRRFFLGLLALSLFVPLPIIVSSWQGWLGANGWLPLLFWSGNADRPWATGWIAAIWIQVLAAIPWVTCIVGLGLGWVEPELEDEAAQVVGPWRVLLCVTLPRACASILAAALFVILQTAGDISVTDMMLISTLAEEVHTQFTLAERAGLARTLILCLPGLFVMWGMALALTSRLEKTLPPLVLFFRAHRSFHLGSSWLRFLIAGLFLAFLVVPLLSLPWKLGLTGHPPQWSGGVAWHHLRAEAVLLGRPLALGLLTSLITGFFTASVGLVGCWLARDCRWFRWLLFSISTWAWVLPGPVVGIGVHDTILALVGRLPEGVWTELLYRGPSPLPLMWVQVMRALPIAVVFLWPIVRMIPPELFDAAHLEGATPLGEFMHLVWPMSWRDGLVTGLAASALCLGEVAASTRVETPGWESFTKLLFDRMHYGVDNTVAALGVLLLGSLVGIALTIVLGMMVAKWKRAT